MKYLIFLLLANLSVESFAETKIVEEPTEIVLARNCRKVDKKACISMDVDVLDKKVIVGEKKTGGETEYTVRLYGKFDKQPEKEHLVKLYGSEKGCAAFGHATVAVLGFTYQGNPILFTENGNLELTSKLFTVGVSNLQIINLKTLKREGYLSRSRDTDKAMISRVHFDANGNVYYLDGVECFELRKDELLRKVDLKKCDSKKIEVDDRNKFKGIRLTPNQKAFEIKNSNFILVLDKGSCS